MYGKCENIKINYFCKYNKLKFYYYSGGVGHSTFVKFPFSSISGCELLGRSLSA